jgi:hypothetical protein
MNQDEQMAAMLDVERDIAKYYLPHNSLSCVYLTSVNPSKMWVLYFSLNKFLLINRKFHIILDFRRPNLQPKEEIIQEEKRDLAKLISE